MWDFVMGASMSRLHAFFISASPKKKNVVHRTWIGGLSALVLLFMMAVLLVAFV
jgi:hypothetical protein